jgi:hypothetical protein
MSVAISERLPAIGLPLDNRLRRRQAGEDDDFS